MITVRVIAVTSLLACSVASVAKEIPDSKENRLAAARRYLEVMPMKDMVQEMITETAKRVPDTDRPAYIRDMTAVVDVEVMEQACIVSMARHFTVKELQALTTFYGSPEGRSAMKKFGAYMADVMPIIQQQVARGLQQLEGEKR